MAKVTLKLDGLKKDLMKLEKKTLKAFSIELPELIKKEIVGGRSPVKGFGRFAGYSSAYKEAIRNGRYSDFGKRKRPVNLVLSGELIESLTGTVNGNSLRVKFDNPLANIHNKEGAGKSKTVRRILPTKKGEQFSVSIQRDLKEILDRIANRIFR